MKVTRRRALFYRRRTSNLYRLFALDLFIMAGTWLVTRLWTGEVRNPFSPTPTATRTSNSWVLEGEASFNAGDLNTAITAYQQATQVDKNNADALAELARIQAYSSRLLSNDSDRLARLTEALQSADQAKALAPEDSNVLAIRAFVLDWNADPALDALRNGKNTAADLLIEADQEALLAIHSNGQNPLALAFYAETLVDEQKWTQAGQNIQNALNIGGQLMDDEGQGLNDKGGYGNNGTRQPDSRRTEGIDLLTNDLLQGNLRRDHPADRTGREFEADRPASR